MEKTFRSVSTMFSQKNDQHVDTIPERIKTVSKRASFIMTKQHFRKVFVKSKQKLTAIRASFTPLHVIF